MSPYEINILLHYYTRFDDWVSSGEPIYAGTMAGFVRAGLLYHCGPGSYGRTEKLEAYCRALCAVPLPVQRWVMPQTLGDACPASHDDSGDK